MKYAYELCPWVSRFFFSQLSLSDDRKSANPGSQTHIRPTEYIQCMCVCFSVCVSVCARASVCISVWCFVNLIEFILMRNISFNLQIEMKLTFSFRIKIMKIIYTNPISLFNNTSIRLRSNTITYPTYLLLSLTRSTNFASKHHGRSLVGQCIKKPTRTLGMVTWFFDTSQRKSSQERQLLRITETYHKFIYDLFKNGNQQV